MSARSRSSSRKSQRDSVADIRAQIAEQERRIAAAPAFFDGVCAGYVRACRRELRVLQLVLKAAKS